MKKIFVFFSHIFSFFQENYLFWWYSTKSYYPEITAGILFIVFWVCFFCELPRVFFLLWGTIFSFLTFYWIKSYKHKKKENQLLYKKIFQNQKEDFQKKIENLTSFFKQMVRHNQINLLHKLEIQDEKLVSLEDYINFLLNSLTETMEWLLDKSEKLSVFSAEINYYSTVSQKKSDTQIQYAQEIIALVQELLGSFKIIVMKGQEAFQISDSANNAYQKGNNLMHNTEEAVEKLHLFIENTIAYLEKLHLFHQEIEKMIEVIFELSKKTQILSLNASIEAVRAGEAGKGFKIVALEIQQFSATTSETSKKITQALKNLSGEMRKSFDMVEESKNIIAAVKEATHLLKEEFSSLSHLIKEALKTTKEINDIAMEELSGIENIDNKINNLQETISDFKEDFILVSKTANYITHSAEEIAKISNNFAMNNLQTFIRQKIEENIQNIKKIILDIQKNQPLEKEEIYKIPSIEKAIYHSLEDIKNYFQEKALEYQKEFVSIFFMDKNGLVRFEKSEKPSRKNQILKDSVTQKTLRNKQGMLTQVYMTEEGIQITEVSYPLQLDKEIMGYFRLEYKPMSLF